MLRQGPAFRDILLLSLGRYEEPRSVSESWPFEHCCTVRRQHFGPAGPAAAQHQASSGNESGDFGWCIRRYRGGLKSCRRQSQTQGPIDVDDKRHRTKRKTPRPSPPPGRSSRSATSLAAVDVDKAASALFCAAIVARSLGGVARKVLSTPLSGAGSIGDAGGATPLCIATRSQRDPARHRPPCTSKPAASPLQILLSLASTTTLRPTAQPMGLEPTLLGSGASAQPPRLPLTGRSSAVAAAFAHIPLDGANVDVDAIDHQCTPRPRHAHRSSM
ncbi:uncharacterized protein PSFLO_03907 [Pseudozyma flocculosa]|uniref:Uncharacterized protein n=1 Tax=Pseudozyma flocculosa TaxID=84751 RepID=A0A5C3F4U1_9BASI|nr:uncharacterized protein PSFLO_03907 [Pseudozyma flocculosa]